MSMRRLTHTYETKHEYGEGGKKKLILYSKIARALAFLKKQREEDERRKRDGLKGVCSLMFLIFASGKKGPKRRLAVHCSSLAQCFTHTTLCFLLWLTFVYFYPVFISSIDKHRPMFTYRGM